jgi:D-glycero-D-manno-heptose 1,7-bisphosphate phosphatase
VGIGDGAGARVTRAVFIDRDGVINRAVVRDGKPYPPQGLADLELLPGVPEAMRALKDAGFRLIVATNQPDVATGHQTRETVEAFHAHLRATLPIDDIRVCYHVDADACACRKPKPGMLLDAARAWDIALGASVMVGDRWRDIDAGRAAGCRTILVESGYDERAAEGFDAAVPSLLEASRLILTGHLFQQESHVQRH